jgi:pantoate--beta-alanine ligase
MNRLLDIIDPDNLFMGQKDYQQCMVVNRLLEIMHSDTALNTCPTLREEEGLAMSSRNNLLSAEDRKKASIIYSVLKYLKDKIQPGGLAQLKDTGRIMLEQVGLKPDYVEIADAITLERVNSWDGKQSVVALIAAFLADVRLIDNMILS